TRSGRSRPPTTPATCATPSGGSNGPTTSTTQISGPGRCCFCPEAPHRRANPPGRWLTYDRTAMDLDVVFLGTAGSAPSAKRSASALLIRRGGDRLLLDCGEGTQRQLLQSTVGLVDLPEIYLTHFHADHFLGLPGMLKTFALRGREAPLTVYGPPGLRELFDVLRRIVGRLPYRLDLTEVRAGEALERIGYKVLVFPVHHGVSAVGYAVVEDPRPGRFDVEAADALGVPNGPARGALQRGESITLDDGRVLTPDAVLGAPRRGRRIVLPGDTAPTEAVGVLAEAADVLVHEATFGEDERGRA